MNYRVIFLLLLLVIPFSQAALVSTSPVISVTLQSQEPDPVEPGQMVSVKFKIENSGGATEEPVVVRLLPHFPFTLYGDTAEKNIGRLRAASTGADAVVVEYKLKVDEQAVEGNTELELQVERGPAITRYDDNNFLLNIQTHDAILDITSITYEPTQIAPGETAKLSISVKNNADSLLKDITFKLNFAGSSLPLAPFQSSSQRRIAQLRSDHQLPLTFQILADPAAAPGLYKIPLNISYNDEQGRSYELNDVLAISVGNTPVIRSYVKKTSVMQRKKPATITIGLANAGTTDIKFMELKVLPSPDFELISESDYFYVGDVDSDDTESEEIKLYPLSKKTLSIPLELSYHDANNQPYTERATLELPLHSSFTLKRYGLREGSYGWLFFFLLLLAGGGYFYYKKFRHR